MPGPAVLSIGDLRLDVAQRALSGSAATVAVSPLATRFLALLAAEPGRTISRAELIDQLWSGNYLVGDKALNRVVSETRRAAREAGAETLIETVQKSGYRLHGHAHWSDEARLAQPRRTIPRWVPALLVFVVVVGALAWLMDSAIGLIWISRHPN